MTDTVTAVDPIDEGSSALLTGVVKDETGTPIPTASLTTAVGTLYDQASDGVINSRTSVDLKPYIDASGNLAFPLTPADNPIVGTSVPRYSLEIHVFLIRFTYASGAKGRNQEIQIPVRQLNRVS